MHFKHPFEKQKIVFFTLLSVMIACLLAVDTYAANLGVETTPQQQEVALEPAPADAHTPEVDAHEHEWSMHAQTTYVWQRHGAFYAPYTGPQSLSTASEHAYSSTFTGYFGIRLWTGAELYFDPEAVQGLSFSQLHGLAGVQNGELQKNGGTTPQGYYARAFLRQSINLGGDRVPVEDGLNQLAGSYDKHRLVFTLGKITLTDIFEKSIYANDSRSQFLNWALITHGAWDFAADARGYTIGGAAELYWDDWTLRGGRFMEPKVANGTALDKNITHYHGDQVEIQHDHKLGELSGSVRVLGFRNFANAGSYRDALNAVSLVSGVPDVMNVRKASAKQGYGMSVEQSLTKDIGIFARASYGDDKIEEYAFAEIDDTVSAGAVSTGSRWGRPDDAVGVAFASNGLNRDHRDYLAAGGLGGFLGDGRLTHYGREQVVEVYYKVALSKGVHFTLDYQQIKNPGYNADRHGPVSVCGARLHLEI